MQITKNENFYVKNVLQDCKTSNIQKNVKHFKPKFRKYSTLEKCFTNKLKATVPL